MINIIGYKKSGQHSETCPYCGCIFSFDNKDIYRDDMGCEITCPNCANDISF